MYGTTYSGSKESNFSTVTNKMRNNLHITHTHAAQDIFPSIPFANMKWKNFSLHFIPTYFISNESLKPNEQVQLLQKLLGLTSESHKT